MIVVTARHMVKIQDCHGVRRCIIMLLGAHDELDAVILDHLQVASALGDGNSAIKVLKLQPS